jgi:hypothetical protein
MGSGPVPDLYATLVKFNAGANKILSVSSVLFSVALPTAKYRGALSILQRNKTVTSKRVLSATAALLRHSSFIGLSLASITVSRYLADKLFRALPFMNAVHSSRCCKKETHVQGHSCWYHGLLDDVC